MTSKKTEFDHGIQVDANSTFTCNLVTFEKNVTITGDLTVSGNLAYTQTSYADIIPSSTTYKLGNTSFRWSLFANTIDSSGNANVGGSLTVTANSTFNNRLDVLGDIRGNNSIILRYGVSGSPTANAFFSVNRGTSPNSAIMWDETNDVWRAYVGSGTYDLIVLANGSPQPISITGNANTSDLATLSLTSNNSTNFNGANAAFYLNANNLNAGTLAATRLPAFGGDVSSSQGSNSLALTTTGVVANTYGNSTYSTVFTVDDKGRLSNASHVAISFPVTSFNTRTGAITLTSSDVTTALTYTPFNVAGGNVNGNTVFNDYVFFTRTGYANDRVLMQGGGFDLYLNTGPYIDFKVNPLNDYDVRIIQDTGNSLNIIASNLKVGNSTVNGTVWHSGNDGSGSTLDADLLDGQHANAFFDKATAITSVNDITASLANSYNFAVLSSNGGIEIKKGGGGAYIDFKSDNSDYQIRLSQQTTTNALLLTGDNLRIGNDSVSGVVWHTNNDGASSGLDADLLDGQEGSYYTNATNISTGTISASRLPLASNTDILTGTSNNSVITPWGLSSFAKSKTSNGYCILPGGIIMQWGTYDTTEKLEKSYTIDLPIAMTNAVLNVQTTTNPITANNTNNYWVQWLPTSSNVTTLTFFVQQSGGFGDSNARFSWFAIGH